MSKPLRLQMRIHESESPLLYQLLQGIESPMVRRNRVIHLIESALNGQIPQGTRMPAVAQDADLVVSPVLSRQEEPPAGAAVPPARPMVQLIDDSDLQAFGA